MATGAGLEIYPALRTRTSHWPTVPATFLIAASSVTSVGKMDIFAEELEGITDLVSVRVDLFRPRRTRCLAPEEVNAMAASRPMPLPYVPKPSLSVLLFSCSSNWTAFEVAKGKAAEDSLLR